MSSPPLPFGNATYATQAEIVAHHMASDSPGYLPLGQLVEKGHVTGQPVGYGRESRHGLIVGPNGSGKSLRLAAPMLLHAGQERSFVVVDPTGELTAISARWRAQCGPVFIIDPFDVLAGLRGCDHLRQYRRGNNVLSGLRSAGDTFNTEASDIAEAIVTIDGTQPFFPRSAQDLIALLIMHEVEEAEAADRSPELGKVRDMLTDPVGLPALLGDLASSPIRAVANKAGPLLQGANSFKDVINEAASQTKFLDDTPIAKSLAATDGPDWSSLKTRSSTVYLILPARAIFRQTKWYRIVLTQAVNALMAEIAADQIPVTFILEEFFLLNKGGLAIIENLLGYVRKYGIQLVPILQDLNQLQELYPKLWQTFMSNAGFVAHVGAPNDLTTVEWLSKRAGDTTVITTSSSANDGQSLSYDEQGAIRPGLSGGGGISYAQTRVPFLTMHRLFNTPKGRLFIVKESLANIIQTEAKIYGVRDHPLQLWKRADPNPYFSG